MNCGNKICPFHDLHEDHGGDSESELSCLITDAVKQVHFSKGDVLFAQGQASSSVFSLGSGIVKIFFHFDGWPRTDRWHEYPGKAASRAAIHS